MEQITIRQPDNFHVHFRQGGLMAKVVPVTARYFARALVMLNTESPILNGANVKENRDKINAVKGEGDFQPLMTIKLTKGTTSKIIEEAFRAGAIAAKYYPVGVTNNAEDGISDHKSIYSLSRISHLHLDLLYFKYTNQLMILNKSTRKEIRENTHLIYPVKSLSAKCVTLSNYG